MVIYYFHKLYNKNKEFKNRSELAHRKTFRKYTFINIYWFKIEHFYFYLTSSIFGILRYKKYYSCMIRKVKNSE